MVDLVLMAVLKECQVRNERVGLVCSKTFQVMICEHVHPPLSLCLPDL